jgi:phosphopantothenoylcysteine synthetase/decarboxylase
MSLDSKTVILGICGGVAAYKSCDIVRGLVRLKADVKCILTAGGSKFIRPLTLQTLSKNKVHMSMFDTIKNWEIGHVSLADEADVILVAPATADVIARLACGRSDDLLTCTILASKAKVLICPAMNTNMFNHKATKNNIEILKGYGYGFVDPERGELACGGYGDGRLAGVETIVSVVNGLLS